MPPFFTGTPLTITVAFATVLETDHDLAANIFRVLDISILQQWSNKLAISGPGTAFDLPLVQTSQSLCSERPAFSLSMSSKLIGIRRYAKTSRHGWMKLAREKRKNSSHDLSSAFTSRPRRRVIVLGLLLVLATGEHILSGLGDKQARRNPL